VLNAQAKILLTLDFHWIFLVLVGGVFGTALLAFTAIHLIMVFNNKTTIESYEKNRYAATAGTNMRDANVNIFNLGSRWLNWVRFGERLLMMADAGHGRESVAMVYPHWQ
jgi:hypothetical protein